MRSLRSLIPALLLVGTVGCGPGETPVTESTTESVALGLFELAFEDDPEPVRVESVFGVVADDPAYAALLDAVRVLREGRAGHGPEIVATYLMEDGNRTGFDLEGPVGDGGSARYSVLLDTTTYPGKIVWFSGPGIEWPEQQRKGPGILTSAPPRAGEEG
jgi:hypothetical protein